MEATSSTPVQTPALKPTTLMPQSGDTAGLSLLDRLLLVGVTFFTLSVAAAAALA